MRHTAAKSFDQDIKTKPVLISKNTSIMVKNHTMNVQEGFAVGVLLRGQTCAPAGHYRDCVGTVCSGGCLLFAGKADGTCDCRSENTNRMGDENEDRESQ